MATAKQLLVTFNGDPKQPEFKFGGVWTGFDISTVQSNLRRAYLRVKRDQRRGVPSENSNNSTKEESK